MFDASYIAAACEDDPQSLREAMKRHAGDQIGKPRARRVYGKTVHMVEGMVVRSEDGSAVVIYCEPDGEHTMFTVQQIKRSPTTPATGPPARPGPSPSWARTRRWNGPTRDRPPRRTGRATGPACGR